MRLRRKGRVPAPLWPTHRGGLTLVELLIALSFLAVLAVTIFGTLSGGFRIWERIQGAGSQDRLVQLTLEQMRRDLSRGRFFKPIGFNGAYDELSFPALVTMTYHREEGEREVDEPGRVGYYFHSPRRSLCRSEHGYRFVRRYRLKDSFHPVLTGIERVRFSYAKFDPERKTLEWSGSWEQDDGYPSAVKIEIGYLDETTKEQKRRTLVVPLYASPPPQLPKR